MRFFLAILLLSHWTGHADAQLSEGVPLSYNFAANAETTFIVPPGTTAICQVTETNTMNFELRADFTTVGGSDECLVNAIAQSPTYTLACPPIENNAGLPQTLMIQGITSGVNAIGTLTCFLAQIIMDGDPFPLDSLDPGSEQDFVFERTLDDGEKVDCRIDGSDVDLDIWANFVTPPAQNGNDDCSVPNGLFNPKCPAPLVASGSQNLLITVENDDGSMPPESARLTCTTIRTIISGVSFSIPILDIFDLAQFEFAMNADENADCVISGAPPGSDLDMWANFGTTPVLNGADDCQKNGGVQNKDCLDLFTTTSQPLFVTLQNSDMVVISGASITCTLMQTLECGVPFRFIDFPTDALVQFEFPMTAGQTADCRLRGVNNGNDIDLWANFGSVPALDGSDDCSRTGSSENKRCLDLTTDVDQTLFLTALNDGDLEPSASIICDLATIAPEENRGFERGEFDCGASVTCEIIGKTKAPLTGPAEFEAWLNFGSAGTKGDNDCFTTCDQGTTTCTTTCTAFNPDSSSQPAMTSPLFVTVENTGSQDLTVESIICTQNSGGLFCSNFAGTDCPVNGGALRENLLTPNPGLPACKTTLNECCVCEQVFNSNLGMQICQERSQHCAPSAAPSLSASPSDVPSSNPSATPSDVPSSSPSSAPSATPSSSPSSAPSLAPSASPSSAPSASPSAAPSASPSSSPSAPPSATPSSLPSATPSARPTFSRSRKGTKAPSVGKGGAKGTKAPSVGGKGSKSIGGGGGGSSKGTKAPSVGKGKGGGFKSRKSGGVLDGFAKGSSKGMSRDFPTMENAFTDIVEEDVEDGGALALSTDSSFSLMNSTAQYYVFGALGLLVLGVATVAFCLVCGCSSRKRKGKIDKEADDDTEDEDVAVQLVETEVAPVIVQEPQFTRREKVIKTIQEEPIAVTMNHTLSCC
jgi:hypothetical protein